MEDREPYITGGNKMKYEGCNVPTRGKEVISNPTILQIQENYCDNVKASACGMCSTCIFDENNIDIFDKWYTSQNKVDNGGK